MDHGATIPPAAERPALAADPATQPGRARRPGERWRRDMPWPLLAVQAGLSLRRVRRPQLRQVSITPTGLPVRPSVNVHWRPGPLTIVTCAQAIDSMMVPFGGQWTLPHLAVRTLPHLAVTARA
jgi:hypothetical protein